MGKTWYLDVYLPGVVVLGGEGRQRVEQISSLASQLSSDCLEVSGLNFDAEATEGRPIRNLPLELSAYRLHTHLQTSR